MGGRDPVPEPSPAALISRELDLKFWDSDQVLQYVMEGFNGCTSYPPWG